MTGTPAQKSTAHDRPAPIHGAMEGSGAYNRHARIAEDAAALALPFLEKAARTISLEPGSAPVVIADYGSSQGKNSLAPVRLAIKTLRTRLGPDRPIVVHHVDLPINDFNTLFEVLDADSDRYNLDEPNVFPSAIGRSFYEQVLPPDSVHLGWSSFAAHWLSRVPALIPGHFVAIYAEGSVRAAFEQQRARDWEAFLSLRANELRAGGRLVVVFPARADDGSSGFENLFDHANAVLAEMVDERVITAHERARMVIAAFPPRTPELLAPFQRDGQFQQLTVEDCNFSPLPDAAWLGYERHGNKDTLAAQHALFFRSVFMPSLALALHHSGDQEYRRAFADKLENGLKKCLAIHPEAVHSFAHTIVLAKESK
jgi:SAM dependent carboxyl methyltransferase